MSSSIASRQKVYRHALDHLLKRVKDTTALDRPFSHFYLENVFPQDLYDQILENLPDPKLYNTASERYSRGEAKVDYVRTRIELTAASLMTFTAAQKELWIGIATALTAPELKQAVYAKLAKDLVFRFGVAEAKVPELAGYSRPTLYRETEGFEIPPHPDTRKKVVTMQIYLPADRSQLDLGTAFYRRRLLALPFGGWRARFAKVKQFAFQPNSAYAFVVNNTVTKKSWHGRETLPPGAGTRNTLLNTFYETPRQEFCSYAA